MKFVNRIEEIKRLKAALGTNRASFTVVFGRRRLGKSTLISRTLSKNDVYFLADQTNSAHQRGLLAKMVSSVINGFDKVIYPDWDTFFDTLNDRTTDKFTLCIDEFPYLVESTPELPSIIQKKLDSKKLKYNILICGSSLQLMYGLVLDATSPLYGRADAIIKIAQIRVPYIQEALKLSAIDSIEEYAVWGGVPRYWELREGYSNLREAIENNLLSVNGILYEEPLGLFRDDIKDIVKTATIMSYVGLGANRLSEIAARCEQVATNLSRPLSKLISLGYLTREIPYGENAKDSKKSLYKISDPFMDFYFRFIVPNRSFIELGRTEPILTSLDAQFSDYVSKYWEKLCRETVSGNIIDGIQYGIASRWWGKVSREERIEIDIVAESLDKKYILLGECKWATPKNSTTLMAELKAKAAKLPFIKDQIVITKLFLKNSLDSPMKDIILPQGVLNLN